MMIKSRLFVCCLACLLLLPVQLIAQIPNSDVARCAVVQGDLDRLMCYDRIALENGLEGPQPQDTGVEDAGDWAVNVDVNPIDDSRTVVLVLFAESGQSRWGEPVALVARCSSKKTDVYINWKDFLGSEASVLTRVGAAEAVRTSWGMSTDKQASFHPNPVVFLKQLIEADRLVAQVTPYNENPVTAIFNLTGIVAAIAPLRDECEW